MSKVDELLVGTKGKIFCDEAVIKDHLGKTIYQYDKKKENNPYQTEHDELFEAIAMGQYKFNDAERGAHSTMTAIMGRMATYSGQVLDWDKLLNSGISFAPTDFAWDAKMPLNPDADGWYPIAKPGVTKYI